jgi:dihydroorotate dehydrogenase
MALHAVYETAKRFPTTPLVGAGGVESSADVRAFLSAGALAVQIDTILWRDPRGVLAIAAGL